MSFENITLGSGKRETKRSASHPPRPCPPDKAPQVEDPSPCTIRPPEWIQQLDKTYICDGTVGKLAVPLVLDLGDLASLVEDVHHR